MCIEAGVEIIALHFNHNLRPEAAAEAQWLGALFKAYNVPFYSQEWQFTGAAVQGRLQAEARNARYTFFKKQCAELGVKNLLLGHTADDVAETTLMRLFYGSGLQGLKTMAAQQNMSENLTLHRPFLQVRRESLRLYLKQRRQPWLEDPSNANANFVRVRARYWAKKLNMVEALCLLSANFNKLEAALKPFEANLLIEKTEGKTFVDSTLLTKPTYLQTRIIKGLVQTMTGHYPPRQKQVERLLTHLKESTKPYELGHLRWQREGGLVRVERPKT